MYSSIEVALRKKVIKKCYWPLFNLADLGFPIGIEAPAFTLEIINKLDPNWIETLSEYIAKNKIEFIGSGYSQIIGPLVPAKVNEWNQKLGLEVYQKLLGGTPKIALVNEMAYSGGIVEHYINAGYEGLIMEWNNPRFCHPEWKHDTRYYAQKAVGVEGNTIPLIWADSIAFQKYQRYAHGETELDEYVGYIRRHIGKCNRFFPLYSNDTEIFDYRPGRYQTEAKLNGNSEWNRIIELYGYLNQQDWCGFVFPSQVLNGLSNESSYQELILESPAQPVPVKKQEKYNINRWALTGRNDVGINSKCYKIYNTIIEDHNNDPQDWKELCYLWSSDFRTHITEKRWRKYNEKIDCLLAKYDCYKKIDNKITFSKVNIVDNNKWIRIENNNFIVELNKNKGLTIQKLVCQKFDDESILGAIDHGFYDDISLGADFYSSHAVIESLGRHKVTDLAEVVPQIVKSDNGIIVKHTQVYNEYKFTSAIQLSGRKIIHKKAITTNGIQNATIRPFNYTFNPSAWDQDSLYVGTHNGGVSLEKYYLKGFNFSHADIYSTLISARHAFGNTEGVFIIGDYKKKLKFKCEMNFAALLPAIIYKEMNGTYFFRLQYSACEIDDTNKQKQFFEINSKMSISA